MPKKVKDHLGNEFDSIELMIKFYGLSYATYYRRKNAGWCIKDILTSDERTRKRGFSTDKTDDYISRFKDEQDCYFDHLGNRFRMEDEMCAAWGVRQETFNSRMKSGWPLEKALTVGGNPRPVIVGTAYSVLGIYYPDIKSACKANGICYNSTAQSHGDDLEEWITSRAVIYYEGAYYNTVADLAEAYGLDDNILSQRLNRGWTLSRALNEPIGVARVGNPCVDHNGKSYASSAEMCRYYGITRSDYIWRLSKGWSLKDTLETPVKRSRQNSRLSNIQVIKLIQQEEEARA